jgi:hypothetical protein
MPPVIPVVRNQRWRAGDTNRRSYTLKESKTGPAVSLANVTAIRMQVRDQANSAGAEILDLSLANGKITKTDAEGLIIVTPGAAATAGQTWSKAFYDLRVTWSNGDVWTIAEGLIVLTAEITE